MRRLLECDEPSSTTTVTLTSRLSSRRCQQYKDDHVNMQGQPLTLLLAFALSPKLGAAAPAEAARPGVARSLRQLRNSVVGAAAMHARSLDGRKPRNANLRVAASRLQGLRDKLRLSTFKSWWHPRASKAASWVAQSLYENLEDAAEANTSKILLRKNSSQPPKWMFNRIMPIKSLGIYCWDPIGLPDREFKDVTVDDIMKGLHQKEAIPDHIVDLSSTRFPVRFLDRIPPQRVINKFPFDPGRIVPLYIAQERGIDLRTVDFFLGGSALHVLANQEVDHDDDTTSKKRFLAQKCPTTGLISLSKFRRYTTNYATSGFQFKRLVTGRRLRGKHDLRTFEHLQMLNIAGYTVLVSADIDALDDAGMPSKITTKNESVFGMQTMFQMLSSGSETLVIARKQGVRLRSLKSVYTRTLDDIIQDRSFEELALAEVNIAKNLGALKASPQINVFEATELDFNDGMMVLTPYPKGDVFPSPSVIAELLDYRDSETEAARAALAYYSSYSPSAFQTLNFSTAIDQTIATSRPEALTATVTCCFVAALLGVIGGSGLTFTIIRPRASASKVGTEPYSAIERRSGTYETCSGRLA